MGDDGLDLSLSPGQVAAAWMLGAFLVVFLATRAVTHLIRRGRGPFADTVVGGVHLHHLVYGIFLMIGSGAVQVAHPPTGGIGRAVLAVLFGAGVALTLDEYALWLRLSDVYWEREGRVSIDAVLVAAAVGGLLVLGVEPFDPDDSVPVLAVSVVVNLALAVVALLKGKIATGIVGVLVPVVALVGALRLARPTSPWARRRYRPGSRRDLRARRRYPEGRRTRRDALVDALAGAAQSPAERRR